MANHLGAMVLALVGSAVAAAPLPPIVEKMSREGITVVQAVTIQGSFDDMDSEGAHLLKLLKGQAYAIDLGDAARKLTFRVEDPDGKVVATAPGQKVFLPVLDGTHRFRVIAQPGVSGRYVLGVRPVPAALALPPGVHLVGGGLAIESALNANDPLDKVRKQLCKTFDVKMSIGKSYTIDMISQQLDSYLRLEDSTGKQLAQDDDGGGFPNARIVFRPQQEDVYKIVTTTFGRGVGNFTLKVREQ